MYVEKKHIPMLRIVKLTERKIQFERNVNFILQTVQWSVLLLLLSCFRKFGFKLMKRQYMTRKKEKKERKERVTNCRPDKTRSFIGHGFNENRLYMDR